MANRPAAGSDQGTFSLYSNVNGVRHDNRIHFARARWVLLAGLVLFSSLAIAQGEPQVTGVDPASGKVNDTVTVSGSDLGKTAVSNVYLSDDKNDYKATIVSQADDKIEMKVPQVKAGDYNISIQVGDKLLIKPVRFKVEE